MINNVFLLNFPITYAGGNYNNDYYPSALTSGGYTELADANLHPIDLLYLLRLSLLFEFYQVFIFISHPYFLIEMTSLNQGVTNSHDEYASPEIYEYWMLIGVSIYPTT
jgi:hypothetical protein